VSAFEKAENEFLGEGQGSIGPKSFSISGPAMAERNYFLEPQMVLQSGDELSKQDALPIMLKNVL